MKSKELTIGYKKKRIRITAENCGPFRKFSGLMFSKREKANILLFEFRKPGKIAIHSFFVFYPFLAVWLNSKNNPVDIKIVRSFQPCVSNRGLAKSLVEIPINKENKKIAEYFFPEVSDGNQKDLNISKNK